MDCENCGKSIPTRQSITRVKAVPMRKSCPECGEPVEPTAHKRFLFK